MKLEVRKATDGTWHWRRVVNGRVTAHGADYNTQAGATRGLLDDMLAVYHAVGMSPTRTDLRESIKVIK